MIECTICQKRIEHGITCKECLAKESAESRRSAADCSPSSQTTNKLPTMRGKIVRCCEANWNSDQLEFCPRCRMRLLQPIDGASPSLPATPRTDALEVPRLETRANAIMAFQIVVEHARRMERLYETQCKDTDGLMKNFKRVIGERDALICNCRVKTTTLMRGENCDVPSCPACGKMRTQYLERPPFVAGAECPHNTGYEVNGAGMWICLGCRADITPELSPSNSKLSQPKSVDNT